MLRLTFEEGLNRNKTAVSQTQKLLSSGEPSVNHSIGKPNRINLFGMNNLFGLITNFGMISVENKWILVLRH